MWHPPLVSLPLVEDRTLRRAMRASSLAVARSAWPVLRDALGRRGTARVLAEVGAQALRGEPFRALGRPVDRRDALSREQAAPVILLYRAARRRLDRPAALELTETLVNVGGVAFLGALLGDLRAGPDLDAASLGSRVGRFFNAEGTVRLEGEGAAFDVTRCRFVELCSAVGAPELMPLFCRVDSVYFEQPGAPLRLRRDRRLAAGDDLCAFRFTWAEPPP